jgi:hypothetical protein
MAKLLAKDYRVWIETATAGTFAMIKGQQTLRLSQSSEPDDTTTKDDWPYKTMTSGPRGGSISVDLLPDLPDVTGFERAETFGISGAPIKVQVRRGGATGASPADVAFEGSVILTGYESDMSSGPVKASFTMVLAAAPTINKLL